MTTENLLDWISQYGYAGIFLSLSLGIVGLPVPDETLLAFAGYLVFKGKLHPVQTLIAAYLGSVSGITISYTLGRMAGKYIIAKFGTRLHLTAERLERVQRWFERLGRWVLVIGYFVPGVRHIIAFAAGSSHLQMRIFAPYAYTGSLIWTATFITSGYFLGEQWNIAVAEIRRHIVFAASLGVLLLVFSWLALQRDTLR